MSQRGKLNKLVKRGEKHGKNKDIEGSLGVYKTHHKKNYAGCNCQGLDSGHDRHEIGKGEGEEEDY